MFKEIETACSAHSTTPSTCPGAVYAWCMSACMCGFRVGTISDAASLQVVLAWNHDGTLLASASAKGTVIRVHRMPASAKVRSFAGALFRSPDMPRQ